jgi:hypothetical protein
MAELADVVTLNGVPINGVTINVYKASRFGSPPVVNTPLPSSPDATGTSGSSGPGAWQITVPDLEDYWAGSQVNGQIGWQFYPIGQNAGSGGGGAVSSVFTRTGAVTAQSGDYTPAQVSAVALTAVAAANGVASLDSGGDVPLAQLGNVPASLTNPMTNPGDTIYGGAAGAPDALGIGSAGQVLTVNSGATAPQWSASSSGFANPMTTGGDIIAGGSAGAPGRLGVGSSGQVLTVAAGTPAWATPGGAGSGVGLNSVYLMYASGANYYIKLWSTGSTTYGPDSAANAATHLGTLLSGSSAGNPVIVLIDPSVNLAGQTWASYGAHYQVIGFGAGQASLLPNNTPNLGSFTHGVSGHTAQMASISWQNVTFETEAFIDYGIVTDITHHNCGYRGVNAHMIDINESQGNGIQYLAWTGVTCVALAGSSGSSPTTDFHYVHGSDTVSVGHSFFEYIKQVGGTSNATFSFFHFANGSKWHRLEVVGIDPNTNVLGGGGYEPTMIQFDGGSSAVATQCPAIWFGFIAWEQHSSTGTPSLVQCGNFTAGSLNATIKIESLWVNTHSIAIFTNGMATNRFSGNGYFIDIQSIVADVKLTTGTWKEDSTFPIRIGPTVGQLAPFNSGSLVGNAQIVSNGTLSLAGTGAWATGTNYYVGGTPLNALVSGTVTLTSADGQSILSAVSLTNAMIPLLAGMRLLVATGGSAKFWKAV